MTVLVPLPILHFDNVVIGNPLQSNITFDSLYILGVDAAEPFVYVLLRNRIFR